MDSLWRIGGSIPSLPTTLIFNGPLMWYLKGLVQKFDTGTPQSIALRGGFCEAGGMHVTRHLPSGTGRREDPAWWPGWRGLAGFLVSVGIGCAGSAGSTAAAQGGLEELEGMGASVQVLWERALEQLGQGDDFSASASAEELLRETGLPLPVIQGAWRMVARGYALYGTPAGWTKVRAASEALLQTPRLPAAWRMEALQLGASAAVELRAHPEAELLQRALLAEPGLGLSERERVRLALAHSLWAQRAFSECRETLSQMVAGLSGMEGGEGKGRRQQVEELRARRQLLLGKCLREEGADVGARLALAEVARMAGQTAVSSPTREAACLLQRERGSGGPRRLQRVLFIGSSHTIRGNVPCLVEQISASAPEGRVRIVAGEQTRMGTGMRGHWSDGVAHDTARGSIAAGGWDTVVVETFYRTSREDLLELGRGYEEEARRCGARLLIYETPVAKEIEYPAAYEAHHRTNVWLGERLSSAVAPCVKAWMGVLGGRPQRGALERLYADWIHASARGAYLSACCLYAALSGESPEGLWAPPDLLSEGEAREYQRCAWRAFWETRLELNQTRQGSGVR
jgi:hypothetical protein